MAELRRILGVFYAPERTFNGMQERPRPWIPLLIIVLVSLIVFFVKLPMVREFVLERAGEFMGSEPERAERMRGFAESSGLLIQGIAGTVLLVPLWFAVQALVFQVLVPLVGGEGKFIRTFTAVAYAGLIDLLGALVKLVLLFVKGSIDVHTDLTLFLPMLERNTYLYRFLAKVDLFTIWSLFVVGVGITVLCRSNKRGTLAMVYGLWLVFIVITSFFGGGLG
jgi:hypothetical protein